MDQPGSDRTDPEPGLSSSDEPAPVAGAVETDLAVETEVVETPPVKIFVPEPPSGSRRVGGRIAALIAVIGILAIAGAVALGYTLNQDLAATRATLSTSEGVLASTTTSLNGTTGELTATTATLNTAKAERATLDAEVADLTAQISSQAKCVGRQSAALAELDRISDLQTANNNRTANGSTWDTAETKRSKAVTNALDAYYQGYSKSFDRNLSSARAWAAKGKEAVGVIAAQGKQQLAEFGLIDRSAKEIEAAINALEEQLKTTESTCKEVD